jgi:hypothetical protein
MLENLQIRAPGPCTSRFRLLRCVGSARRCLEYPDRGCTARGPLLRSPIERECQHVASLALGQVCNNRVLQRARDAEPERLLGLLSLLGVHQAATRQVAGVDRDRIIETTQEGRTNDDCNRRVPLLRGEMRIRASRQPGTAPPAMWPLRPPMFRQR